MGEPHRILLIDDDKLFCRLISTMLVNSGYEVIEAPDGLAALDAVSEYRPSLILLDMYMPSMNGWGFLEKYRELEQPGVPVIALSANKVELNASHKVTAFLLKPFNIRDLITRIDQLLEVS